MGKITMFNPQSGVTQQASDAAYSRIYAGQGWQLVETPPEVDPDLQAARDEADAAGVQWHAKAKADTIRAKVQEHLAEQAKKDAGKSGDGD